MPAACSVLAAFALYNLVWYVASYVEFWHRHLQPAPLDVAPFLATEVEVTTSANRQDRSEWLPKWTLADVRRRGFASVGLTLLAYLRLTFTLGLEYRLNVMYRYFMVKFGFGAYGAQRNTPAGLYRFAINTSVACYIDTATGHVEMYDTAVFSKDNSIKLLKRITLELDHERQEAGDMIVDSVVIDDIDEKAVILHRLFEIKSHVHVHWWANSVAQLRGRWSLADESNSVTQWMNNASTFQSGYSFGVDHETFAALLFNNVTAEGMPTHSSIGKFTGGSLLHAMTAKCRRELRTVLPSCTPIEIEGLIAGTIMHSADHWYANLFTGFNGESSVMDLDYGFARMALTPANTYQTIKLRCAQHRNDPVCEALHRCAMAVDPEFAEHGLFMACAN